MRLLQLCRPLLARHPSPVIVEAGIAGVSKPQLLVRPNRNCKLERSERGRTGELIEKERHTEPRPRPRSKNLLPVRAYVAKPPQVALAPDTAPLGVPCLPRAAFLSTQAMI